MGRVAGTARVGIVTEWRIRRNRFGGCRDTGCPFFAACSSNRNHQACPFGDEAFEAANPRDREDAGHNDITDALVDWIADMLAGEANAFDPETTYVSVGTGTAVTDPEDSQLQNEVYRDTFVDIARPSRGKVVFYWFFGPDVANGTHEEWGFVANGATGSLGSGDLINRFRDQVVVVSGDVVVGQYSITFA